MPLQVSKSFFKNINLSIWNIDESEDFFLSQINLTENCKKRLELIKSPQKRKAGNQFFKNQQDSSHLNNH